MRFSLSKLNGVGRATGGGDFRDRRLRRKQGAKIGEAVKTDSDEQERPSALGTARKRSVKTIFSGFAGIYARPLALKEF